MANDIDEIMMSSKLSTEGRIVAQIIHTSRYEKSEHCCINEKEKTFKNINEENYE